MPAKLIKSRFLILYAFLPMVCCFCASPKKYDPVRGIEFYPASGKKHTLNELIRQEFDQNRKPVLYFGAEWCGPCRRYKASLSDPLMREALEGTTLIMIDIDTDSEEDTLSVTYDVHAVPTFIRVNRDGASLKRITSAEWDEDIPQNIAPVMKHFLQ